MICISAKTSEERAELISFLELIDCNYGIYNSDRKGILGNIIDFFLFFSFIRKNKVKKIIGAPCSRNRYISFFLGIPFASYMRSVHPDPNALTSLSDILHYRLSKIGINLRIFNPYEADSIFISTEINRDFLLKRGVDTRKIFNVGAIWLNNIVLKPGEGRVIYLTQSFSSHRNIKASQEQNELIKKVSNLCLSRGMGFVLRKHPRDSETYEFMNNNLEINTACVDVFLKNINEDDIFVGSFSTMILEIMSLGGKFIPIKMDSTPGMNDIFEKYNMNPISVDLLKSNDFISMVIKNKNLFSSFDSDPVDLFCNS